MGVKREELEQGIASTEGKERTGSVKCHHCGGSGMNFGIPIRKKEEKGRRSVGGVLLCVSVEGWDFGGEGGITSPFI